MVRRRLGRRADLALNAGYAPERIVLHGNAKSEDELRMALRARVGLIVVDNFDEIDRLERLLGGDALRIPGRSRMRLLLPGRMRPGHRRRMRRLSERHMCRSARRRKRRRDNISFIKSMAARRRRDPIATRRPCSCA